MTIHAPVSSGTMTLERLEQFGAAWAQGDLDALMSFVADDCVYHASVGPEPGTTYEGRDAVRRGFAAMLSYDRGRERHGGNVAVTGDRGMAEWSFIERGNGRTIRGCDLFEFAGDQIRRKDAFRKVADVPPSSPVTAVPPAPAAQASGHFAAKLAYETDPADVWRAIETGTIDFVLVDCRAAGNHAKTHLPGALSVPWQEITAERVATLPDLPLVTYCWGPSCNAATKGAQRLTALGRQAKEMIGGLEYWIREGHPTEGRRPVQPGQEQPLDWGLKA